MPPMRVSASALAGVAVLALAGCGGDPEPPATVSRLAPSAGYNDGPVDAFIQGGPFRPAYTIDVSAGSASIQPAAFTAWLLPWAQGQPARRLDDLVWKSTTELAAEIPAALPPGFYDLELQDPRGNATRLGGGYESLGPDRDLPVVTIETPAADSVVTAGSKVQVVARADDGRGKIAGLEWTLIWRGSPPQTGFCDPPPDGTEATCAFTFTAPTLGLVVDTMTISIAAVDRLGNRATASAQLWVGLPPTVDSFFPSAGPTTGMIEISVEGTNFIEQGQGTKIFLGGVEVAPLTYVGTGQMRGQIPPHDPGLVPLIVKTGDVPIMPGFFDYVARPEVRVVAPQSGPTSGGTPVKIGGAHFRPATRILFGDPPNAVELVCPVVENEHLITGLAPPGTGSVSVLARDPIGGESAMADAFQYLDTPGEDGGAGLDAPAGDAGGDDGGDDAAADAGDDAGAGSSQEPPMLCPSVGAGDSDGGAP